MKITKKYIQEMIKEETAKLLKEAQGPSLEEAQNFLDRAFQHKNAGSSPGTVADWMIKSIGAIIGHLKNPPAEFKPPIGRGDEFKLPPEFIQQLDQGD